MSNASVASDTILPPRKTGQRKPQNFAVTSTPSEGALWTGLGSDAPTGLVYCTVKAIDSEMWIWFKADTSDSVGVTNTTGYFIPENGVEYFWLHGTVDGAYEAVSTSNGTLQITVSSPEYNKSALGKVL